MAKRKRPNQVTETEVLTRSRRRCCICFGLSRDVEIKAGQIAHLDGNNSNNEADNLAFLCFEHHDQYDSTTSQSKNFTIREVKRYKEELQEKVLPLIEVGTVTKPQSPPVHSVPHSGTHFDEQQRQELKEIILEVLTETAGPLRSISSLAHRLRVTTRVAELLLSQLAQEGILRVDRLRGSTRKTYSVASSLENRLIDTFVATLGAEVQSEERYLRSRTSELDSVIRTAQGATYAVETMFARKNLSHEAARLGLRRLAHAKGAFGVEDAISALLIGITESTGSSQQDLSDLEDEQVIIRYVDLEEDTPTNPST
jgi:predicted transcriptional regulator